MQAKKLNQSVCTHFGFKRDPFRVSAIQKPEHVFMGGQLMNMAKTLTDAIESRGDCTAVIAPRGSGKTVLMRYVAHELNEKNKSRQQKIKVISPQERADVDRISASTIYAAIINKLSSEANPKIPHRSDHAARRAKQLLAQSYDRKPPETVCLMIDDAHKLHHGIFNVLKQFLEIGTLDEGFRVYLSLILIGQEPLERRIKQEDYAADILIRTDFLYLHPGHIVDPTVPADSSSHVDRDGNPIPMLSPRFIADYIKHKITSVGGDVNAVIDPALYESLSGMCETARDIDNIVNHMFDFAYYKGASMIKPSMLEKL